VLFSWLRYSEICCFSLAAARKPRGQRGSITCALGGGPASIYCKSLVRKKSAFPCSFTADSRNAHSGTVVGPPDFDFLSGLKTLGGAQYRCAPKQWPLPNGDAIDTRLVDYGCDIDRVAIANGAEMCGYTKLSAMPRAFNLKRVESFPFSSDQKVLRCLIPFK